MLIKNIFVKFKKKYYKNAQGKLSCKQFILNIKSEFILNQKERVEQAF